MIQDRCRYCGNGISNGIVFCEYCGTKNLEGTSSTTIDSYNHEMFEYHITVFAAKYVYDCILQYNLASQPIESYIENLANVLRREFSEKELEKEWLDLIKSRKRFKKRYKRFQSDLNLNQQFRQKFLIYSRDLIRTILELINPKADFSNLQGIKRDIAKVLTKRILFENDNRFPEIFRHKMENSLIRLSVIKIGDIAHKGKVKVGQIELENTEIAQIADDLKTGIIISESIKQEYLDKMDRAQINQFNTFYQKLRSELKADKIYNECFGNYLRDLINHTYENVSSERDDSKLLALEGYLTNQWKKLEKLTQKNQSFEKITLKKDVEKILDEKKEEIKSLNFYPDVNSIVSKLPYIPNNKQSVGRIIKEWIRHNNILDASNLKELKLKFGLLWTEDMRYFVKQTYEKHRPNWEVVAELFNIEYRSNNNPITTRALNQ